MKRMADIGTVLIVVAALCAVSFRGFQYYDAYRKSQPQFVEDWEQYSLAGVRVGKDDAPVTVVEFLSFECSVCARAADYMLDLPNRFGDSVQVVLRNYVWSEVAENAALAWLCAAEQGRGPAMYHELFWNRDQLGQKSWTDFGAQAGVDDLDALRDCVVTRAPHQKLVADTIAAHALQVAGTPTFLVNSRKIHGFSSDSAMDSIIRQELIRARSR